MPPLCVMLLPLTFGSGMALLDTLDGIMMVWAYGWAMVYVYNVFDINLSSCPLFLGLRSLQLKPRCRSCRSCRVARAAARLFA